MNTKSNTRRAPGRTLTQQEIDLVSGGIGDVIVAGVPSDGGESVGDAGTPG